MDGDPVALFNPPARSADAGRSLDVSAGEQRCKSAAMLETVTKTQSEQNKPRVFQRWVPLACTDTQHGFISVLVFPVLTGILLGTKYSNQSRVSSEMMHFLCCPSPPFTLSASLHLAPRKQNSRDEPCRGKAMAAPRTVTRQPG